MVTLEWEHIWARYERRWRLRDVCLRAQAGEAVGLVGPAGSGKSTMLRVAAGLVRTESGHLWVNGGIPRRHASGVLPPDDRPHPHLTVARNIERRAARSGLHGRDLERRLRLTLRAWDLEPFRDVRARTLPSSILHRLCLAGQWACPGSAWLLDNPAALLDPDWRDALPRLLAEWRQREGGATVMAANTPDEASGVDAVAVMVAGRIAAMGEPARICRAAGTEQIVVRTVDDEAAAVALRSNLRLEAEKRPEGLLLRVRRADEALGGIVSAVGAGLETVWVRRPTLRDAVTHYAALPPPPDLPTQPPIERQDGLKRR
ncbi:MAG TPA: ATP-binding cassette domain-containing protein [Armatimonadota bacterium]